MRKVFVVGAGGREHALLWTLRKTTTQPLELLCAPGNAGIEQIASSIPIDATDVAELANFSAHEKVDLTIVGPEAPLAMGIVNVFENRGLKIVGPRSDAARLESSKAFAKDFMKRHDIPTANYQVVASGDEAIAVLRSSEFGPDSTPVVIKADGLAGGKGVIVAGSHAER